MSGWHATNIIWIFWHTTLTSVKNMEKLFLRENTPCTGFSISREYPVLKGLIYSTTQSTSLIRLYEPLCMSKKPRKQQSTNLLAYQWKKNVIFEMRGHDTPLGNWDDEGVCLCHRINQQTPFEGEIHKSREWLPANWCASRCNEVF